MENIAEVAAALVAAQAELKNPPKTRTAKVQMKAGGTYTYTYADCADVIDVVRPVFAKHGLTMLHLMQQATQDLSSYVLIARVLHKTGQCIDSVYPVPDGMSAQELGSWMTYMRRYSTCNMAFISGETDEDGEMATGAHTVDDEKRKAAAEALEKAKAERRIRSAYTGEVVKPGEDVKPPVTEEKKSESVEVDDMSMLKPALRTALQKAGVSKKAFHEYYVSAGHFPAEVGPEDLDDDYLSELLDERNWNKAVAKMTKGAK